MNELLMLLMVVIWSTAFAVDFTTTNPDPVGPEWPHMDPGSKVLGNPGQKFAMSRVPPAQLQLTGGVTDAVTRGSAFTTQLSSSKGLVVLNSCVGLLVVICVASCPPSGAQVFGEMQSPTGSELELVTASPWGLLTPVLTLDSGLLAPLKGGAPNCRILPVPGVNWASKAYGKVE